ncbi:hypothetical protein FQA39_LY00585 [Lamprigera yunnana]|nr:hypothetical protein FQA39_LY00585 [Lamprigera yunnana]
MLLKSVKCSYFRTINKAKMPSLLEALEQKYGESSTESSEEEEGITIAIFVPRKSPRISVPSLLVLNDCNIASAGDKQALVDKCAGVEELDLAKNKLQHWPEVFSILKQMPQLKFVNLSFNQLSSPLREPEILEDVQWENLRNLVMNSTQVPWVNVQQILNHLPRLEELHLSLNEYDHVNLCSEACTCKEHNACGDNNCPGEETTCDCPKVDYRKNHKHEGIQKVHFTGNPISKWSEICKIGYAFPSLESLVVANCPIKTLDIDNEDEEVGSAPNLSRSESECESSNGSDSPHDSFRKLKFLNLNSTEIATWDDVERLSKFPVLQCLRVQGCRLWESHEYTEHERRQFLIARLPNVETLNGGGKIEVDEREDAERAFIRYYTDKPESDRPDRYFDLVAKHGKLDPLVNVDLRPEKRVKVRFTCGNNTEIRSVDVYRTVNDLKLKLEAFAGFSASNMRIFYVDQELRDHQGPEEMRYPHKRLYSYNIRSGDEIIIDYKMKNKREKIVPKNWIIGEDCFWPNFKSTLRYEKALKNFENPEEDWCTYPVRILGTYSSYEIAKPKLKLAEEQSDLNSDNEQAKRNRKFKRKKVLASSDDEVYEDREECILEPFPTPPISNNIKKYKCDNKDESQKIDNCSNSITHNIEDGEYSSENEDISDGDMLPTIHRPLLSSTRPHHSKHQQALKNSTPSSRPSSSQSFTSDEDFKTKLLQQLSAIKVNLIKLNRRISLLENSKENVSKEDTIENETSKQYEEFISNISPLQNEDLVVVEVKLEEEPGFKVKLNQYCCRIGGHKTDEITKLMLRRLFSDKLASLYSWLGAKKKKVFCHIQLANVIINSVCTANKNTANCTEKDVVDSIKNWLCHASTRDKKNKVCV